MAPLHGCHLVVVEGLSSFLGRREPYRRGQVPWQVLPGRKGLCRGSEAKAPGEGKPLQKTQQVRVVNIPGRADSIGEVSNRPREGHLIQTISE